MRLYRDGLNSLFLDQLEQLRHRRDPLYLWFSLKISFSTPSETSTDVIVIIRTPLKGAEVQELTEVTEL
jgi:hypothetical protein